MFFSTSDVVFQSFNQIMQDGRNLRARYKITDTPTEILDSVSLKSYLRMLFNMIF